jgi:hypothetical protein
MEKKEEKIIIIARDRDVVNEQIKKLVLGQIGNTTTYVHNFYVNYSNFLIQYKKLLKVFQGALTISIDSTSDLHPIKGLIYNSPYTDKRGIAVAKAARELYFLRNILTIANDFLGNNVKIYIFDIFNNIDVFKKIDGAKYYIDLLLKKRNVILEPIFKKKLLSDFYIGYIDKKNKTHIFKLTGDLGITLNNLRKNKFIKQVLAPTLALNAKEAEEFYVKNKMF